MKIIRKKNDSWNFQARELFTTQNSYDYNYLMSVLMNLDPNEIYFEHEGCEVPCLSQNDYSLACRLFQISLQTNVQSRLSVSLC